VVVGLLKIYGSDSVPMVCKRASKVGRIEWMEESFSLVL
jgi:hypothetical protein